MWCCCCWWWWWWLILSDRAILREIHWLRLQQLQSSASPCSSVDHAPSCQPVPSSQSAQQLVLSPAQTQGHLVDELRLLRRRRDELECRMVALQSSRRQLMYQLDTLMTVLKARPTLIIYNNNNNNTKRKKNEEGRRRRDNSSDNDCLSFAEIERYLAAWVIRSNNDLDL